MSAAGAVLVRRAATRPHMANTYLVNFGGCITRSRADAHSLDGVVDDSQTRFNCFTLAW